MPVMFVTGQKSARRYVDVFDAMQKCLPSVSRVTIPDGTHQMHRTNPAAFDAALIKFLLD